MVFCPCGAEHAGAGAAAAGYNYEVFCSPACAADHNAAAPRAVKEEQKSVAKKASTVKEEPANTPKKAGDPESIDGEPAKSRARLMWLKVDTELVLLENIVNFRQWACREEHLDYDRTEFDFRSYKVIKKGQDATIYCLTEIVSERIVRCDYKSMLIVSNTDPVVDTTATVFWSFAHSQGLTPANGFPPDKFWNKSTDVKELAQFEKMDAQNAKRQKLAMLKAHKQKNNDQHDFKHKLSAGKAELGVKTEPSASQDVRALDQLAQGVGDVAIAIPPGVAMTGRKCAFVVGNKDYFVKSNKLVNAIRDADCFEKLCEDVLGFTVVKKHVNVTTVSAWTDAFEEFLELLRDGDLAVIFYAGHGCLKGTENVLLCTGAPPTGKSKKQPQIEVSVETLLTTLQKRKKLWGITMILDACRTPEDSDAARDPNDDKTFGPWRLPVSPNHFYAFACAPGHSASDNKTENNGLFTKWLLHYLKEDPAMPLADIMSFVTNAVLFQSKSRGLNQIPWQHSSMWVPRWVL